MNFISEIRQLQASYLRRRCSCRNAASAFAGIAAASLLTADAKAAQTGPMAPRQPHFPGKAKRVVYMFQAGRRVTWRCLTTSRNWPNVMASCLRLSF